MRSNTSAISSPHIYSLVKEQLWILTHLTGRTQHTVKNSTVLAERIQVIQITPEDRLRVVEE